MEYMVVWLHDFTDTYYSVHGLDQIDDAEAFYQKLATNNPNIFSCLGKVEIVEQQFTSSPIFDGLPRPSNDRASGTEEDDSVDWVKRRLIQGQAVGKAVCMATLSLTCEIRSLPHVGSLSRSAVDGLPEGRIGSCCFFGEYRSASSRNTAFVVAQIFSITFPKLPVPRLLGRLPSTKCRLQFDGTARALRASGQDIEEVMLSVHIENIGDMAVVE